MNKTENYQKHLLKQYEILLPLLEIPIKRPNESDKCIKGIKDILSELQSICIELQVCLSIIKFNNKESKKNEK